MSKQDIRIADSQMGSDIEFSSMPTGEMPTPLLIAGLEGGTSLLVSPRKFSLTISYDLFCDL